MSISHKHQKQENCMIMTVLNFEITVVQFVRIVHFNSLIISRNVGLKIARIASEISSASFFAACVFIKIFHIIKDSESGKNIK